MVPWGRAHEGGRSPSAGHSDQAREGSESAPHLGTCTNQPALEVLVTGPDLRAWSACLLLTGRPENFAECLGRTTEVGCGGTEEECRAWLRASRKGVLVSGARERTRPSLRADTEGRGLCVPASGPPQPEPASQGTLPLARAGCVCKGQALITRTVKWKYCREVTRIFLRHSLMLLRCHFLSPRVCK